MPTLYELTTRRPRGSAFTLATLATILWLALDPARAQDVPDLAKTWTSGERLLASELNDNFSQLRDQIVGLRKQLETMQQRVDMLEAEGKARAMLHPLDGTAPAFLGYGNGALDTWDATSPFCEATATLPKTLETNPYAFGGPDAIESKTYAYGPVVFTRGGMVNLVLGSPYQLSKTDDQCKMLCFPALMFYLKAKAPIKGLDLEVWMDDLGGVYVEGKLVATLVKDEGRHVVFDIDKAGTFTLTFLACSNWQPRAAGSLAIARPFLTDYHSVLEVDYDKLFPRDQ